MADFTAGRTRLLVATTVIEVGVDVPEASVMVIEHAERFGLAPLHQLRGRVGRGAEASFCLLLHEDWVNESARRRLTLLRDTDDGFLIADEDYRHPRRRRHAGHAAVRPARLPPGRPRRTTKACCTWRTRDAEVLLDARSPPSHPTGRGGPRAVAPVRAHASDADAAFGMSAEEPIDADLRDLAPHVDPVFCYAYNPDISAAGLDAVLHYARTGWREGRNPSPWFDTSHYLLDNPDVRESGMNPLLHYVRQGKAEGRVVAVPGGTETTLLERLETRPERVWIDTAPSDAAALGTPEILEALRDTLAAAYGFAMSLSHDNYKGVSGGTQAVIADEQRKYNGGGWTYLHLSPTRAGQTLAEIGRAPDMRVVCDGVFIGIAPVAAIVAAMTCLPPNRVFIVHALHGHEPVDVAALAEVVDAARNVFWAHDYFAACEGYRLLRNELAFCHAPPPDSMACLVCVHGDTRPAHLARIRTLFARVDFEVVAPSPVALAIWIAATQLPIRAARAHAHCKLIPSTGRIALPRPADDAIQVAYVGSADFHKGWPLFQELVRTLGGRPDYRFRQFADRNALRPQANLTVVAATVRPDAPLAMVDALRDAHIDFVVLLSPWPETFSLVTMEALAAGADVLTLGCSGNPAAIVAATSRGRVFDNAAVLSDFFVSGEAIDHARARRRAQARVETLLWTGTTATLDVPAGPAMTQESDLRLLLDNVVAQPHRRDGDLVLNIDGARELRIVSHHAAPADVRPELGDRRQRGVAIGRIVLDGCTIARGDARFGTGWHTDNAAPFWTDGDGRLCVEGVRQVVLNVSHSAITWIVA